MRDENIWWRRAGRGWPGHGPEGERRHRDEEPDIAWVGEHVGPHHLRRGHVHGPGFPGGPGGFGFWAWPGGPGPGRMRGPRARRGDVRAAALALLAEGPMNGYQIIQEIAQRSDRVWRPSPGSVYPALQQLEDEGLVRAESEESGRRRYALTDAGRDYVAAHPDEVRAPWDVVAGAFGGPAIEMRRLIGQVAMAAFQVVSAGSDAQVSQARQVLTDTRRTLYRILAADDDGETGPAEAGAAADPDGPAGADPAGRG